MEAEYVTNPDTGDQLLLKPAPTPAYVAGIVKETYPVLSCALSLDDPKTKDDVDLVGVRLDGKTGIYRVAAPHGSKRMPVEHDYFEVTGSQVRMSYAEVMNHDGAWPKSVIANEEIVSRQHWAAFRGGLHRLTAQELGGRRGISEVKSEINVHAGVEPQQHQGFVVPTIALATEQDRQVFTEVRDSMATHPRYAPESPRYAPESPRYAPGTPGVVLPSL